jgi:hypothetical protein
MFQIRSALLLIGSDPNFSSADPMLFLGCLSPEEMLLSARIGWYAAAFAIGIIFASVLLSLSRGSFVWSPLCVVLLLIHPAWTMDVVSGDCGYAKRFLSGAISLVLVVLLICQIFLPRFSRLRFLLILCGTSWAAWLSLVVNRLFHFLATPNEGFIQMMLQSWVLSYHDLFRVALALSFICLFLWLYEWTRGGRKGVAP